MLGVVAPEVQKLVVVPLFFFFRTHAQSQPASNSNKNDEPNQADRRRGNDSNDFV